MQIRRYERADHDRVLELHEAALRDAGGWIAGTPEPDLDDIPGTYLFVGSFSSASRMAKSSRRVLSARSRDFRRRFSTMFPSKRRN